MSAADRPRKSSLPALTGARFFAAFAVVVHHYGGEAFTALLGRAALLFHAGPAAVSFFYVLSGAVLTWGCTGEDALPARPAAVFWRQRAARLLPAYGLALALSFLPFCAAVLKLHPGSPGLARIALGTLAGLLLLQALIVPLAVGLNTPGWSISCEVFFYALWSKLVVRLRSKRPDFPWARALLLALLAWIAPLSLIAALRAELIPDVAFPSLLSDVSTAELLTRTVAYFPPLRLPEFALGIALGHALKSTPERPRSRTADTLREFGLVLLLLGSAWVLGSGAATSISGVPLAARICTESGTSALLFSLIVWQLARGEGLLARLLSRPSLLLLGEASYALYVLQEPVLVWMTGLLKRVRPEWMEHWQLLFWGYAAVLIALSVMVHQRWETPLRGYLLQRWNQSRLQQVTQDKATH